MTLQVTLQPIKVSYLSAKCRGHRHSGSGDIMVLVCYMILQNHTIKQSYNFMGRSPSRCATILPSLAAIATLVVELK